MAADLLRGDDLLDGDDHFVAAARHRDVKALGGQAARGYEHVPVLVAQRGVYHHHVGIGRRYGPGLLAGERAVERLDVGFDAQQVVAAQEIGGPEREVLLAGAKAVHAQDLGIIDDLELAGLDATAEVGRKTELLEADVRGLDAPEAPCPGKDIDVVAVDDAHDREVLLLLAYQLIDEGHGVL